LLEGLVRYASTATSEPPRYHCECSSALNSWTIEPYPSVDEAEAAVLAIAAGDWDGYATAAGSEPSCQPHPWHGSPDNRPRVRDRLSPYEHQGSRPVVSSDPRSPQRVLRAPRDEVTLGSVGRDPARAVRQEVGRPIGAPQRRAPGTEREPGGLAHLQQRIGNRELVRMLGVQTKLAVGRADDPLELEADHAAAEVARRFDAALSVDLDEAVATVRRQAEVSVGPEGGEIDDDLQRSLDAATAGGAPLAEAARAGMEAAFGTDFGGVRVHAGPAAADLSRQLGARAFTLGRDIFFRDGIPDVASQGGRHLLAHELAHTIQQGHAPAKPLRRRGGDEPDGSGRDLRS
jgi:hypothetical protein